MLQCKSTVTTVTFNSWRWGAEFHVSGGDGTYPDSVYRNITLPRRVRTILDSKKSQLIIVVEDDIFADPNVPSIRFTPMHSQTIRSHQSFKKHLCLAFCHIRPPTDQCLCKPSRRRKHTDTICESFILSEVQINTSADVLNGLAYFLLIGVNKLPSFLDAAENVFGTLAFSKYGRSPFRPSSERRGAAFLDFNVPTDISKKVVPISRKEVSQHSFPAGLGAFGAL